MSCHDRIPLHRGGSPYRRDPVSEFFRQLFLRRQRSSAAFSPPLLAVFWRLFSPSWRFFGGFFRHLLLGGLFVTFFLVTFFLVVFFFLNALLSSCPQQFFSRASSSCQQLFFLWRRLLLLRALFLGRAFFNARLLLRRSSPLLGKSFFFASAEPFSWQQRSLLLLARNFSLFSLPAFPLQLFRQLMAGSIWKASS